MVKMQSLMSKLDESNEIYNSSTDMMVFLIQNLQDYAQIKMGKFNKILKVFDIKKALDYIVKI